MNVKRAYTISFQTNLETADKYYSMNIIRLSLLKPYQWASKRFNNNSENFTVLLTQYDSEKKTWNKKSIWIWWPSAVYERRSTKPKNNNLIYFVSFGCYHLHGVIHNVVFVIQRHASGSCSFNKLSMITIHIVLFYVDNMLNV